MRSFYKHIVILSLSLLMVYSNHAEAVPGVSIQTYYPVRSGEYDLIRLLPRSADLTNPCVIGSIYANNAGNFQYCRSVTGAGTWGPVTDIWTQIGDNIYLTDTPTNTNLNVGIGTITPEFKLSLINDAGMIAQGTFGSGLILQDTLSAPQSRLIWYPRKSAFRAGHVDGIQWNNANIGDYSTAMGKNSTASGSYSNVAGGDSNIASGQYANVIGGQSNTASGNYSAVTGGLSNTASGHHATIPGGHLNIASADFATVLGGHNNQATAIYSTISGGENNIVSTPYSNINGGKDNLIDYIGAGAATGYAVIGGGLNNKARNDYIVISGGENNTALAPFASIGGGKNNTAGLDTLGVITGAYSRVSGGENNLATGDYSVITGGRDNIASGTASTIGGGWANTASGNYSVVGGGERNTASGDYSMILGGTDNIAAGEYSWAGGKNMQLTSAADNTFVWGYSDTPVSISTPNAFIIASGTISSNPWNPKVGVRDLTPAGVLEINAIGTTDDYINIKRTASGDVFLIKNNGYIGVNKPTPTVSTYAMQFGNANNAYLTGGGVWTSTSSKKYKENIQLLSSSDSQAALDQLNPVTFNYKLTPKQKNIGFIAEDVPQIVAMNDRASLNTLDFIAVLTKVAQDQEQEIKKQSRQIEKIRNNVRELKRMLGE
ncbi:MAG: tail fiber domain-containing protein [Candidatus Omnitrophica bacterium]|nr:tail fiber domain-containing protein [Candidatus Omnitrophota bacterium]